MSEIKATRKKLADYTPDPHNANLGSERGYCFIDDSITEDGVGRSGLADKNGKMIAGNQTLSVLAANGIEDVIEVETTGKEWVVVKRTDTDLDDDDPNNTARRMAYRDNRSVDVSLTWNPIQLQADKEAGVEVVDKLWSPLELEIMRQKAGKGDDNYSRKIGVPTYNITGINPPVEELFNDAKTQTLIQEIEVSEFLNDEERKFLIVAAQRHTVLDFGKIAEFYAHANEEVQALMENSALVIIDLQGAIERGFATLTNKLMDYVDAE